MNRTSLTLACLARRARGIPTVTTTPAFALARTISSTTRRCVVAPDPTKPSTNQPELPRKGGNSTLLYLVGGLGLAGGVWYYYTQAEDARLDRQRAEFAVHERVRKLQERIEGQAQVVRDKTEVARGRVEGAVKDAQGKYEEVRDAGKEKLRDARDRVDGAVEDGRGRVEDGRKEVERRVGEAKDSARE
ncbi:hypothetical protein HETIRDRAFT_440292 [Heterobasidion irregulare TC 32-1]|uniref:Uncharacterized protein n=1 Tax=Heterobasidion irregulare (strain TC 32-1) TaxID=747525 RepID=W4K5M6_HETIT|nr:uncharacterized protein HETIRDRAFT_440292 [Heterobasidion irregulare TC 32-1]ETW80326.1 hypothetical protein HETIRDRAFT_440292 [Heterobasidion irregulare TC 32-1]